MATKDTHNADLALDLLDEQFGPNGDMVVELEDAHRAAYPTRERWLRDAIELLRKLLEDQDIDLAEAAEIRVSCAWPSRGSRTGKRIGECWDPKCSEDATWEIMISYLLAEPTRVLDVLLHELLHVALGIKVGHKSPFKRACDAMGLEPTQSAKGNKTYTATVAGEALQKQLEVYAAALGTYPHAPLKPSEIKKKVTPTRMLKVGCPDEACGIIGRMTLKYIESDRLPTCVCGERWVAL